MVTNRISEFLSQQNDPPDQSAAQKENASRQSGGLPRGIISRYFDGSQDHRNYTRILTDLTEELRPQSFTHREQIASIAHDYIQLAYARQMINELLTPGLSPDERSKLEETHQAEQDVRVMRRLFGQADPPAAPICSRHEAQRLAERIGIMLQQIEENDAEAAAEAAECAKSPDQPPVHDGLQLSPECVLGCDEFEQEEEDRIRLLVAALGSLWPKFKDRSYVADVLSSVQPPTNPEWKALHAALTPCSYYLTGWINLNRSLSERAARLSAEAMVVLSRSPQTLILVDRHVRMIERTIQKKLSQLWKC